MKSLRTIILALLVLSHISDACYGQQKNADDDLKKVDWWKKTNFYHIYVRSFKDSDGDGNGDLRGIIEKLDYLQMIGVETILMAPFYTSPMKDGGYDVSNYRDINPLFGNLQDFDDLLGGLKQRNMRMVIDFIPNHTSNQHPWFKCSEEALTNPDKCGRYKDYYLWSNSTRFENKYPNNWLTQFGGKSAWQWSEKRKEFYYHQFLAEQPDLNVRNEQVRAELRDVVKYWMDKGVDGIRVDAALYLFEDKDLRDEPPNVSYVPTGNNSYDSLDHIYTVGYYESYEIIKEWHDIASSKDYSEQVIIVEAYDTIPKTLQFYGPKPDVAFADMPFNFELLVKFNETDHHPLILEKIIIEWLNATKSLGWPKVNGVVNPWSCWVTGNHDRSRLANRIGSRNLDFYKWMAYLTIGVPVDYNGDELGILNANFSDIPESTLRSEGETSRLPFRTPMAWTPESITGGFSTNSSIWLPQNENFKEINVETLLNDKSTTDDNHLRNYIKLKNLRRRYLKTLTFGDLVIYPNHPNESNDIFAMSRLYSGKGNNLLILSNFNSKQDARIQLLPRKTLYANTVSQPPHRGTIVLVNFVGSSPLRLGSEVNLQNLALKPSQSVVIAY